MIELVQATYASSEEYQHYLLIQTSHHLNKIRYYSLFDVLELFVDHWGVCALWCVHNIVCALTLCVCALLATIYLCIVCAQCCVLCAQQCW